MSEGVSEVWRLADLTCIAEKQNTQRLRDAASRARTDADSWKGPNRSARLTGTCRRGSGQTQGSRD